ncbi:MAG: LPS assembly lipoprotein LptE [Woeseiaceae bacterium]|nr:LPS assembly lipoprotein LptE [Woeseiaceae bacterium]
MSSSRRFALPGALLLVLLAGCGFQLQGAVTIPPEMDRTYISAPDRQSLFYRELRRELLAAGVVLTDFEPDATATITIYYDETDQRVLSVSARNVPTEYEVYYTIEYGVTSGDATLLEVQDLTLTRDYTYDATLVLGKAREEEQLREAIARDLVRIVLKQISTK